MKKYIILVTLILLFLIIIFFAQDKNEVKIINKTLNNGEIQFTYKNKHLIKVKNKDKTIEYSRDQESRKISKKINGVIKEKYLWLSKNQILAILDENDNIIQEYHYKNENDLLPSSMTMRNSQYTFIYNKMHSLKLILNQYNKIIKIVNYSENGEIIYDSNPSFKIFPGFAGGLYDEDTQLISFLEGVYSPKYSQWITKIDTHDIISNLKELNNTNNQDVYVCTTTLDTYYHSYICANQQCGGLYANDYLNYFNGTGEIIDNSRYFNHKICKKIQVNQKTTNKLAFTQCVSNRIQPKLGKVFDVISSNCHHEVSNIIKECTKKSQKKEVL